MLSPANWNYNQEGGLTVSKYFKALTAKKSPSVLSKVFCLKIQADKKKTHEIAKKKKTNKKHPPTPPQKKQTNKKQDRASNTFGVYRSR